MTERTSELAAGPILVFDSGIGGLSVLREARLLLPSETFVYLADAAAFPYGDWPDPALVEHLVGVFDELIPAFEPRLVILACNTASTLVLPALRARFDLPFVGTVPAIKPAAERTRSRRISVLGTPGTVVREYTHDLIAQYASGCEVELVGSSRLAALAEAHLRSDSDGDGTPHGSLDARRDGPRDAAGVEATSFDAAIRSEIAPCFVEGPFEPRSSHDPPAGCEIRRTDIVVLACTHYPFLVGAFRRLAPWPVDWLDPAEAIARRARHVLPPAVSPPAVDPAADGVTPCQGLALVTVAADSSAPAHGRRLAAGERLPTGSASLFRAFGLEPRIWERRAEACRPL